MKALYNPLTRQERRQAHLAIKRELRAQLELERDYMTFKIIGMAVDVLHDNFGFGRVRACRFVKLLGDVSQENLIDTRDGADDEFLLRRLTRMKMPELADMIRQAGSKLLETEDEEP